MTLAGYVSDHRLNDRPLMPGVLSVEMLLAGASQVLGTSVGCLRSLAFHRPAWAEEDGSLRTQLRCRPEPRGVLCQLFIASEGGSPEGTWLEQASAVAEAGPVSVPEPLDLAAVRERCSNEVAVEDLYGRLAAHGLQYGPSMRALQRVTVNGSEVFSELCVLAPHDDEAIHCRCHPALLDGSLQALAGLAMAAPDDGSGIFLPFAAEEVRIYAPLQGRAFGHGRVFHGDQAGRYTAEVTVTDETGRILVEMRGLSARRVPSRLMSAVASPARPAPASPDRPPARIFRPLWRPSPLRTNATGTDLPRLIFADTAGVGAELAQRLAEWGPVIVIVRGSHFRAVDEQRFELRPETPEDYTQLWQTLLAKGVRPGEIIHCWACDCGTPAMADLRGQAGDAFFSLAHLVRTLRAVEPGLELALRVVTADCQFTRPSDCCDRPSAALAWGLGRVLGVEYRPWRIQCLDISLAEAGPEEAAAVLMEDLTSAASENEVAFRSGQRLVAVPELVPAAELGLHPSPMRPGGVYLIAGGLGGIGLALAEWIARTCSEATLVLAGRTTPLPPGGSLALPDDPLARRRVEAVGRIEARGARVETVAIDVGDMDVVRRTIADIRTRHGRLDAVFHSAGVLRDALLQRKPLEGADEVFHSKVAAALALDAARGDASLVLFSSVVGWLGNAGQADYAAANRLLDSFAVHCTAQGRPTWSIAWGPWGEVGMAAGMEQILRAQGIEPLKPDAALDALGQTLTSPAAQFSIAMVPEWMFSTSVPAPTQGLAGRPDGGLQAAKVQAYLTERLAEFLEIDADQIDPDAPFQDFGIDSISAVQMLRQIEDNTGLSLPPTLLFDHADLPSLASYLYETVPSAQLEALLRDTPVPLQKSLAPPPTYFAEPPHAESNTPPVAAPMAPVLRDGAEDYGVWMKPLLARRLAALRLDKRFLRGAGGHLEYEEDGRGVRVLDLLGGFGATLFGHNHPELVAALHGALQAGVPTHAQASLRGSSGQLARELSARVRAFTGRDYVAVFANSGAEAIEAALKHAWMEARRRVEVWRRRQRQADALLLHAMHDAPLSDDLRRAVAVVGEDDVPSHLSGLLRLLDRHNALALDAPPRFFAVRRSFHGKTAGALRLTFNPGYQVAGAPEAPEVQFLDPDDAQRLREAVAGEVRPLLTVVDDGRGGLALRRRFWCSVAAAFVEPVQGEGGVYPLSPRLLAELRDLADRYGFPVVVDEVQTGLGRCGRFTAAETAGLRGDYYAFGKALGGGLAKISALLIQSDRYVPEFDVVHSSTFAEDDPSALVALEALRLLDRDGLPARCAAWGEEMLAGLDALRREFPDVIDEIRGQGCLIGIELAAPSRSPSALIRLAGSYLGLLGASYLLNVHRIRLLPTTSAPLTLRLEPWAYVSREEGRYCLAALRQLCLIISRANAGRLVRHLVGSDEDPLGPVADWSNLPIPEDVFPLPGEPKVSFFSHFVGPEDIVWWDPSLEEVPRERLGDLIRRFSRVTPPTIARRARVRSSAGGSVHFEMVGFLVTSDHLAEALQADDLDWLRAQIDDEIERAVRGGARAVGLGGYLSIVTHNAVRAARADISLTTGNALTVSAGLGAWRRACRDRRIDLRDCSVGIVGAYGNIGSTYTRLVAEEAGRLLLIGRPQSRPRLQELAAQLLHDAWDRLTSTNGRPATGIAAELLQSESIRARLSGGPLAEGEAITLLAKVQRERGDDAPLRVSDDLHDLRFCPAVLTASNAPEPIIFPRHLASGPVVICDVAVPTDIAAEVARDRPDVLVIPGGEVRLPLGQRPGLCGCHLPPELVFACVAETLLVGLSDWKGHFSFGPISRENVHNITQLAQQHGFGLSAREDGA